ncbi:DUF3047 domain-containing protein [soil metagenome]
MKSCFAASTLLTALTAASLMGCAGVTPTPGPAIDRAIELKFSSNPPGGDLPQGWQPLIIRRDKTPTVYTLVTDRVSAAAEGVSAREQTVVQADSASAASGLRLPVDIDPSKSRCLRWDWKIANLIEAADATSRQAEDSPVRIVLAFDGDLGKLSMFDRILGQQARLLGGHELPYATLIYIWEPRLAVDSIVINSYSSRIRKLVAQSGADGVGRWQHLSRDIVADFERVYGEAPGRLLSVGIMTDTDNTQTTARSWYGDIGFTASADCTAH